MEKDMFTNKMLEKTCCVTGHRNIPADAMERIKAQLQAELHQAIADGFTTFLSGMAEGVDLLFATLVIEQKQRHPHLRLEAILPYAKRRETKNQAVQACLNACDHMYIQQAAYHPACYFNRNRYMVERAMRVIAVHDGRETGGTVFTMGYAKEMGREVRVIGGAGQ